MQYPEYQEPQHLTPQQYLRRFKTPHSVINATISENAKQDFDLLKGILDMGYNDTQQTKANKQKALSQLKECVKTWLKQINPNISERCGLQIFGSYRMGVSARDSDIDAVCIVPSYVNRHQHFFEDFVNLLKTNPNITQLFPIQTALLPLIKLKLYDVQFDILMSQIPDNILSTDFDFNCDILDLIQQKQRKFINGCRMAAYLEKNIKNLQVFRLTLKAIKMWARNKGVYLQMFSYLGGIGYTVLLAKIIQLYPNYSPLKLLSRFFYIYSKWVWEIPVILQQNSQSQHEIADMIIMTPLHPTMNTSHSVSRTTLRIIRRQFKQAYKTIQQIQKGSKPWNDLFAPYNIIKKHKHFLQISIMSNKKQHHIVWKGHIQSKFRKLLKLLQSNNQYGNMIQVHPFPKQFISKHPNYIFCSRYYIGIKCKSYNSQDDSKEIDFTSYIRNFLQIIESSYDDIQMLPEHINIGAARVSAEQVAAQINQSQPLFYKHV